MRFATLGALACAAALLAPGPAPAQDRMPVDLELALAADGSGSIDDGELALQRDGYARAIADPEILRLITGGLYGRIVVSYIEWGGPTSQHTIVDWTVIDGEASAEAFGRELRAAPRAARGYNSISAAIDYAVREMETNAYQGLRRVIDVSADGPNIGGRAVAQARDDAVGRGMTVNALLVLSRTGGLPGWTADELMAHYEADVIGGTGAFVTAVEEDESFAEAVRDKLILEIARALDDVGTPETPASLETPPRGGSSG